MLGKATFTIVMSTSSMNVVAQTASSVQRRFVAPIVTGPILTAHKKRRALGGAGPTNRAPSPGTSDNEPQLEPAVASPGVCPKLRVRGVV